jgi:hypothetical protein
MEVMIDDRVKQNLDEEFRVSMEVTDRSLEKIRSITAWWDSWDERQKTLSVDEDCQVLS